MSRLIDPINVLKLDRQRAFELATKRAPKRMRELLKRAQSDLNKRLLQRPEMKGVAEDAFTTVRLQATLYQIQEVLNALQGDMKGAIVESGREAAFQSSEGSLAYLQAAENKFRGMVTPLPLNHSQITDTAVRGTEASLLRRILSDPSHKGHKGVLDRYGEAVTERFQEQLQLRLLTRKSWEETRKSLIDESPFLQSAPAHWAERVARTESMFASNAASQETIAAANVDLGDMVKILAATFDSRTAADSYAVHGQIRRTNEPFDTWQGSVMHPPARPNDREIVVPHRLSWPIPATLKPKSDSEVASRWMKEGHKQAMPSRPKLSTIPNREMKR